MTRFPDMVGSLTAWIVRYITYCLWSIIFAYSDMLLQVLDGHIFVHLCTVLHWCLADHSPVFVRPRHSAPFFARSAGTVHKTRRVYHLKGSLARVSLATVETHEKSFKNKVLALQQALCCFLFILMRHQTFFVIRDTHSQSIHPIFQVELVPFCLQN